MTDKFEAKGNTVYRKSEPHPAPRRSMQMGFPVLEVNPDLEDPEEIARAIAEIFNKHWIDA
ncbi:MAG: hypothetical protein EOQ44_25180 [Mesorhizobium sp.]|uniref:hypothetical protein n=1 Tax=Mesorhizobium sp. TaxID=1871066 RepID=UPI000FE54FDB|nr:hypothetical protein [Mesorhizobium sp.]RWB40439.1 MAG: hypothetical protein EOQ44_25180 [Mesorhizobium sp.]